MYNINDEAFAIREVQRFLLIISEEDDNIPHIAVDGIYTEEFNNTVSYYQSSRGLPSSGKVDKETFDMLFFEAEDIKKRRDAEGAVIEIQKFPLRLGDSGPDVSTLNNTLDRLIIHYKDLPEVSNNNFFNKATEDAVKYMQVVFGEVESGIVSALMLARLLDEVNEREKFIIR